MRRTLRFCAALLATALVVLPGGIAYSTADLEPVLTGRAGQYSAFGNDPYVVYTLRTHKTGELAMAESIPDGTTTQLNADGTQGLTGGIDPGTNRVVFMQWGSRPASLWFYDLDTDERWRVPGVNSRDAEAFPRISATFIAFDRWYEAEGRGYVDLLVFDRESEETRTIGTWRTSRVLDLFPDFVGDRYLTYTVCKTTGCDARLYDLESDTMQLIPRVNQRRQMGALVDETNSTVYFARIGNACGGSVMRLPIDLTGEATRIFALPKGIAAYPTSLAANATTGHTDLFFNYYYCDSDNNDVYVARSVDAEPPA